MVELTLEDLIANRTMSPAMAQTFKLAAQERRSFLFVAIPRMAGKSTTMKAVLEHRPTGVALHQLSTEHGPGLGIPAPCDGGYLVMSEIAQTPFPDYLWGDDVRTVFSAMADGYALATALHAPGLDEAFEIITQRNGISDEQAARIDLVAYVRSLGHWRTPDRRVIESLWEIQGVSGGRPDGRLLHRWIESDDRFDVVADPNRIGTSSIASKSF